MTDDLPMLRASIDSLDDQLRTLLVERRAVSARIQELRRAAGGGPVDPAREATVVAGYVGALGTPGEALAHAVLDACRPKH